MDVDQSDGVVHVFSAPLPPLDPPPLRASSEPLERDGFTVGYVYSSEMMVHYSPHGHPEEPSRISRIFDAITAARLAPKMKQLPTRQVKKEEALLVHSEDHWDKVIAIQCESQFILADFIFSI